MAGLRGRGRLTRSITATVVLLVVGLCLAACQATVQVAVDANLSGAGSITVTATLDREAAAYASDVQFSDLVKAGWSVTGPNTSANGAVTFIAARSFSNPTQAKALFAQLSGTAGPFRGLSLVSRRSLFKSSTTFKGSVDLTCGLDCFGDAQLRQTLGGSANFGIDPAALKNDAGIDLDNLISFQLVARLPGKVMSNAPVPPGAVVPGAVLPGAVPPGPVPPGAVVPGAGPPSSEAQWKLPLGKRTVVMASSQAANVAHIVIAAVAAFVLLVALVVGMVLLIRRRRRQRPGRAPKNRSRRRPRLRPVKPVNGPTPSVPSAR